VSAAIPHAAPPSLPNLELLQHIGEGSYGEVWLARTALGSFVAVKLVRRARFTDQRHYDKEFNAIRKYEHVSRGDPSQLRLLHAGCDEAAGFFYYTMELADDARENPKREIREPNEVG